MKQPALLTDFHADGTYDTLRKGIVRQVKALGLAPVWKEIYTAYLLATVKHETGGTFRPIEEGGKGRGRSYGPSGYYGRGFVQLTWLKNYQRYNDLLRLDLVANPGIALRSDVSLYILVHGCYYGIFTGRGFNDYHNPSADDFEDMRKIVNGTDRDELIAGYAREYLKANLANPLSPVVSASPVNNPLKVLQEKTKTVSPATLPVKVDAPPPSIDKTPEPEDKSLTAFLMALGKLMQLFGNKP